MNLKVLSKWTGNYFEMLKLLKEVLLEDNNCPENYYETRKLSCEVGLGYEQIDVCQRDCCIFYGELANAESCLVCDSGCYIHNKILHKRLWRFPIKSRLKRLFSSKHIAKNM